MRLMTLTSTNKDDISFDPLDVATVSKGQSVDDRPVSLIDLIKDSRAFSFNVFGTVRQVTGWINKAIVDPYEGDDHAET
jgi:hypothetical protein